MALLDFILNLVALALWLNWLAIQFDPLTRTSAASLVGTLRKADPHGPKRWKTLASLVALLLGRAIFYWQASAIFRGAAAHWTPNLDLGIIDLSFRGDFLGQMLVFSLLSFVLILATFYFWIILLSVVNIRVPDLDPFQKLVRLHIKWIEKYPRVLKLLTPFFLGGLFWLVLHPLLARIAIVSPAKSGAQLGEQVAIIGLAAYLTWKYLIVGVLLLHLLNSYVYLGNHAFWNYINLTARNLLAPLRWLPLRMGKMDFLPPVGIALVFLVTETFSRLPIWLPHKFYHLLPF